MPAERFASFLFTHKNGHIRPYVEKHNIMYLTVEDLKKHLNVDHSEDDVYIGELAEVAEDAVAEYLNRPIADFVDENGKLKASVRHAIRLLVGTWYASRESVAFATPSVMPDGVYALLMPLRRFVSEEV
jgi:hypothetical protein